MEEVIKNLYRHLEQRGWQGRVVSIQRLQDLKRDIIGRHAQGEFDEDFYQERLTFFDFELPDKGYKAESIIVVAMPRPQHQVIFTWEAKTITLILPPTYVDYKKNAKRSEEILAGIIEPKGFHASLANKLPLKTLAVRSGLGEYGRNNICYVAGMGSFLQLAACFSDLPIKEDNWRESAMLERCNDCQACLLKCPSQAITAERFLLRAERCIVFHNEKTAEHPFPEWLDLSSHDCLLGCMYCQRFCPEDKEFLGWFEGGEAFSHEETSLLLKGATSDQLPVETVDKLRRLDLLNYLEILPRNLGVLFGYYKPPW